MTGLDIYFWEPCVSPHKVDLVRHLARDARVRSCRMIAQQSIPPDRASLGWTLPPGMGEASIIAPSGDDVERIVVTSPADSIHIFSGMHWVPCIVQGLRAVRKYGRRFGIMSEPRAFEGIKGISRLAHSWLTEAPLRRRADFVLAIGRHGPRWFEMAGYAKRRIFPFAYFLPEPERQAVKPRAPGAVPIVGFLGRLERSKGIHLFLGAVTEIGPRIEAVVAGSGSASAEVVAAQSREQIAFHGAIPMESVPAFLADVDVLMVPSVSQDDGWAAVVSEALMAGAAVVASDRVGASVCLSESGRGLVVGELSAGAFARAVLQLIDGNALHAERGKRSQWARARLTGAAGASYLMRILEHVYFGGSRPALFYEGAADSADNGRQGMTSRGLMEPL